MSRVNIKHSQRQQQVVCSYNLGTIKELLVPKCSQQRSKLKEHLELGFVLGFLQKKTHVLYVIGNYIYFDTESPSSILLISFNHICSIRSFTTRAYYKKVVYKKIVLDGSKKLRKFGIGCLST